MTQANPYQSPQSDIATAGEYVEIDSLAVSETWKKRFRGIQRAGGPGMPLYKSMTVQERRECMPFNILAFLFGPFYYLAKGMWRRGLSLFLACLTGVLVLSVLLDALGWGEVSRALGYGVGAIYALRANIDYYKKMVLQDNGWW